jgi:hypothetical protein
MKILGKGNAIQKQNKNNICNFFYSYPLQMKGAILETWEKGSFD